MKVVVAGANGQVGAEVARLFGGRARLRVHDRQTMDVSQPAQIVRALREDAPDVIVNAAAYTAVDQAESEAALAHAVNAEAPRVMAEEARRLGALLVHYSTDYVFDGTKAGPYVESDAPHPLGTYGRSKLAGEQAVAASGCRHVILRTSWIYGPRGKNFLLTMLRLAATRDEVRVVDDQRGAPTSSLQLARATVALFAGREARALVAADAARVGEASGIYHASASGEVTWCGFARAIFERWPKLVDPAPRVPRVVAIPSSEYPTPVQRPANSRLSGQKLFETFRVSLEPWEAGLDETLRIKAAELQD